MAACGSPLLNCLILAVFVESFLNTANQRDLFTEIVFITFYESVVISPWSVTVMCAAEHIILEGISIRFFDTMCKNLLLRINKSKPTSTARKVR